MMSDTFDKWNEVKKKLDTLEKNINIKEGNIYLASIGKNIGSESYGKGEIFLRPVLVLKKLGHDYFIAIPLTSKKKIGSYFFEFLYKENYSYAMFNQIKTINTKRILKQHGKIQQKDFRELKKKFQEFLY